MQAKSPAARGDCSTASRLPSRRASPTTSTATSRVFRSANNFVGADLIERETHRGFHASLARATPAPSRQTSGQSRRADERGLDGSGSSDEFGYGGAPF